MAENVYSFVISPLETLFYADCCGKLDAQLWKPFVKILAFRNWRKTLEIWRRTKDKNMKIIWKINFIFKTFTKYFFSSDILLRLFFCRNLKNKFLKGCIYKVNAMLSLNDTFSNRSVVNANTFYKKIDFFSERNKILLRS